ncbi:uncharacterized protein LOC122637419 isoform X1 [Vespula pensylvanica]|uniref:CHK kinase-like domain-containing protein n=2 Tax=Vespula pensylvanica TaxID=30213 RepID=A0A834P9W5_VESPE|nr:uncharacterized protein LOC122637419 isoform X1 [Vespula pensylvanica]XP_043685438.1 uncharacterized protein LOC122637419 isoform X1 [Vespula pensylvanica]XP_043685439.1 uncharacterized protein LOC122637419 isoform X1 [Vespula pensylvanica]KAF7434206.1 hypothetical protein H0235_002397 [Vespula pensylvanica]
MTNEELKGYNMEFIKTDLLPEMVYNRCFCESGSREFVEFESAIVESLETPDHSIKPWELYRVKAVVRFSGEPVSFPLIVKLLPSSVQSENSFGRFQNEEMFYSKMISLYGKDLFPKCYASDMGRYGMPVIVLEDLTANEYEMIQEKRGMNEEELKLSLKSLGRFHGIGLRLKNEKFQLFREFYMKLSNTVLSKDLSEKSIEFSDDNSLENSLLVKEMKKLWDNNIGENASETCTNVDDISCICHGDFSKRKVLFKREKNGTPIDVKMIDWQTMRYCSPAIELVIIFIMNIPTPSRDQRFLQEILTVYVDAVRSEYTSITCERLIEQLSSTSLDYFTLLLQKDTMNKEIVEQWIKSIQSFRDFLRD